MSSNFPIFQANEIVLTEIILLMNPKDIVSLSLCSKRTNILVKTYRLKKSPALQLNMIEEPCPRAILWHISSVIYFYNVLGVAFISELNSEDAEMVKIGRHQVPIAFDKEREMLKTYWDDRVLGLKTIIDYVSDLFSLDVVRLNLRKTSFWMLDWIKTRQCVPINHIHIETDETFNDEEFSYMLRNCHPSKILGIYASAPEDFCYTERIADVETISISAGHWVTIDNLLAMDCIEITVWNAAKLTNREINRFLKNWLSGGSPRLEFLNIETETIDRVEILGNGLEEMVKEIQEVQTYQRGVYGRFLVFEDGYSIQRHDGVKATIKFFPARFYMAVWKNEFM